MIQEVTEIFANMHFIRPVVLLALPLVVLIIWLLRRRTSGEDGWAKICDAHLLNAIKVKSGAQGSKWGRLIWPVTILSLLAIAGPSFRQETAPVIKNQSALIIVLDVSRSMLSNDIKPNRLERAKFKINDILNTRKDGQTALLVYAGDAFVVTPLTDDTETISLLLKSVSPDIMPVHGSRADIALNKAQDLLTQAGYLSGQVILIADSVNLTKAEKAAENLAADKIRTSVLAVGTKNGAPIPLQTGFVKDKSGNIVVPKLDVNELMQLAEAGKGRFSRMSGDSSDIDYLLSERVEKDNGQSQSQQNDEMESEKDIDEGPWLVLLVLPFFALLFRRGILLSLFLVSGIQMPQVSYAFGWDDLWMNADQQAAKHIQNSDAQKAYDIAKSKDWKAAAAYRKGDYADAKSLFDSGTADGFYNKGNALAQSGNLQEALDAYNQSLKLRPEDEDTLYNKKQVEEALKQQQEQEQNKQNDDQKKNEDSDQNQQDQQQQNENQQEQENQQDSQSQQDQQQDSENQQQQNQESQDNPDQQQKDSKDEKELTEEEKKQQQMEQEKLDKADQEEQEKQQQQMQMTQEELQEEAENKEAVDQWLRRIPDDPGGLLRRKFYYQYNQQQNKPDEQQDW